MKKQICFYLLMLSCPHFALASQQTDRSFSCQKALTYVMKKIRQVGELLDGTAVHKSALDKAMEESINNTDEMRDFFVRIIAKDFPPESREIELENWFLEMFRAAGGRMYYTRGKKAQDLSLEKSIEIINDVSDFRYFYQKLFLSYQHLESIAKPTMEDIRRMQTINSAFDDYSYFIGRSFNFKE